jgi:hypothetical protein
MLSRPPTKIALTASDVSSFEVRKAAREAERMDLDNDHRQRPSNKKTDGAASGQNADSGPKTREERIGVSSRS